MTRQSSRSNSSCRSHLASLALGSVIGFVSLTVPPLPANDATQKTTSQKRFEFTQKHMGMPFRLAFYASSEAVANEAAAAAFDRVRQLDRSLSDYDPDSELMRLCSTAGQGRPVQVSDDLLAVLVASQDVACRSGGAFDVTVGPLVRLWRRARKTRKLPPAEELADARRLVGWRNLTINCAARTVELRRAGMQLDLGGIAAGYACDEALAVLRRKGINRAMIDASGDIVVGDPPPGEKGWRIGVAALASPRAAPAEHVPTGPILLLANAAVTTSGDAWQHVEIDGRRYSHIVDPTTGLGLTDRISVTVIAPTGIAADSLATAVSVLGPDRGLPLIDSTREAAALIVRAPDGIEVTRSSSRWRAFETAKPSR
jgi:thiamine biosynthesis lipoprotein